MRIPTRPLAIAALCALATAARTEEPNQDVVKAIRAMLDTKKEDERDQMKAAILKRPDLDWKSFRAGVEAGPYFQKPLETAYGDSRPHRIVALTPQGRQLDQALVEELAREPEIALLSSRFEGFDERIVSHLATDALSTSGGWPWRSLARY